MQQELKETSADLTEASLALASPCTLKEAGPGCSPAFADNSILSRPDEGALLDVLRRPLMLAIISSQGVAALSSGGSRPVFIMSVCLYECRVILNGDAETNRMIWTKLQKTRAKLVVLK